MNPLPSDPNAITDAENKFLLDFGIDIPLRVEWPPAGRKSGYFPRDGHIRNIHFSGTIPRGDSVRPITPLTLDESFNTLHWLEELVFENCTIRVPAPFLLNLPSLRDLTFSNCDLEAIPPCISNLKQIRSLSIEFNQLTEIPHFLRDFLSLYSLNLKNNALIEVSEVIRPLTSLTTINLCQNRLQAIPDWVGEFVHLENLDLSHNHIHTLPDSLGQLMTLKRLDLSFNRLTNIPYSLVQLQGLDRFMIGGNLLESMPMQLWEKFTDRFAHMGNKWVFPPREIGDRHLEFVLQFLRGYTPEVFLKNVEEKVQAGSPLLPEERAYPEMLKLTAPLERLCERYPQSPTIPEIKELLMNFGKVKSHNSNPSNLDLFL